MPEKRDVRIELESRRPDGPPVRSSLRGELYRTASGWALTYRERDEAAGESATTLFARERELRLRRRGPVSLEQRFVAGQSVPGSMETPFGAHRTAAFTNELRLALTERGGTIEWAYELTMQDQQAGSFRIRLDIREE